jgi:hypothetical protein
MAEQLSHFLVRPNDYDLGGHYVLLTGMPCDGHFVRHKAVARSRNLLLDSPSYEPKGYRQNVGGEGAIYAGWTISQFSATGKSGLVDEAASDAWGRKTSTRRTPCLGQASPEAHLFAPKEPDRRFRVGNSAVATQG